MALNPLSSRDRQKSILATVSDAPASWADFARFLGAADGKVLAHNGVQFIRDRSAAIAGLSAGDGWSPYDVVKPEHFNDFASYTNYATLAESSVIVSGVELAETTILSSGDGSIISGKSPSRATISRGYPRGTLINLGSDSNVEISGLTLDMAASVVNEGGHAIRSVGGGRLTVRDVDIYNYAWPVGGAGGGTGILVASTTDGGTPTIGNRLRSLHLSGSTALTPEQTFGWIFSDAHHSFASEIYSENALGIVTAMAHELKNDARWNNILQLTAKNSIYGLGYGQTTDGVNGVKFNMAASILADGCDRGVSISEGNRNLTKGLIHDPTGSPGSVSPATIFLNSSAERNVFDGVLSNGGSSTVGVLIADSFNNFASISMMGNVLSPVMRAEGATSARNVIEVQHPGGSATVRSRVQDTSGNSRRGSSANVVYCHATGERIGSLSGTFTDVLSAAGDLGITWNVGHYWRKEADTQVIQACGTNGTAGNLVGITHATPDTPDRASLWQEIGATPDEDFWQMRGWGLGLRYVWARNAFRPGQSAQVSLGDATRQWSAVHTLLTDYGSNVRDLSGAGSPEGVVTSGVGSTYRRRDGTAGTCFYVKESGTGNTGWVAK